MKPRWFSFWLVAGLAHLAVAGYGSLAGNFPPWLSLYGAYTGALSTLKFFAPGVGSQLMVSYEGTDRQNVVRGDFLSGRNETDLRIAKIVANFWRKDSDDRLRRALAASLAGNVFGRNPELKSVTIKLDAYELPDMRSYRLGNKPFWRPYYYSTFQKPESLSE